MPPSGTYTFTVSGPDGPAAVFTENFNSAPVNPIDKNSISPTLKDEFITAAFDNVYVNGALYDDFSYATINDLDLSKWNGYGPDLSIVDDSLQSVLSTGSVGRAHGGLNFRNPETITSIQADITINNISSGDGPPRARIAGYFFNNGNSDVWASVQVKGNRIFYDVSEDFINQQGTYQWNQLDSGDLMPSVSPGTSFRVSISWDESQLHFSAENLAGGGPFTASYTPAAGYLFPPVNPGKYLQTRIQTSTATAPTFSWGEVTTPNAASRYRLRIYNHDNSRTIWRGYPGRSTVTVPPGVLHPNSYYRYRFEAWDTHDPLNVDNVSKTPASNNDNYTFYTGDTEDPVPFIGWNNHGVYTSTAETSDGVKLSFWIKVHDANGVPGGIQSVTVTHPGGAVEALKYWGENPYNEPTETSAIYYLVSDITPVNGGTYIFTATDSGGEHSFTREEVLTVDPVDFIPTLSMFPSAGVVIGDTAVNFNWDVATGATYYSLSIFDYDFNRIYHLHTTGNSYSLPRGFLEEGRLYRWRIHARREYFDDNVDNMSIAPSNTYESLMFATTSPIDNEFENNNGDGIPDYWEELHGLDPIVDDSALNPDNDGLTNIQEFQNATEPNNPDTDGDGMLDGWEVANSLNPLFEDSQEDPDNDGLSNLGESQQGTNPNNPDSDGDWVSDGVEVTNGTDPNDPSDLTPLGTGAISGMVKDANGDVITDAQISVHAHGVSVGTGSQGTFVSQANGGYAIIGLPPGSYNVEANNNAEPRYVRKYYNDRYTWDSADTVAVTAGSAASDIDFTLELAGSIRGRVTDENGDPIPGLVLQIWGSRCWENNDQWPNVMTDDNGDYQADNILPGDYYIRACPDCVGKNYFTTWWTAAGGVQDWGCSLADPIAVVAEQSTNNIDFTLKTGPQRINWWEVAVYNGELSAAFDLWPGYDRFLETAVLTGPNGFSYSFDFERDVFSWLTECSFLIARGTPNFAEFDYGEYTLTLNFIDGAQEVYSRVLAPTSPPAVDKSTAGHIVNADGSIEFSWSVPDPNGYYHVRIYGPDGNRYYRSGIVQGMSGRQVSANDLRCLEKGQTYRYEVRSYDSSDLYNAAAKTERIDLLYDPGSLPNRIRYFDAKNWKGKLALGFSVRWGSQDHITQANVSGPNGFSYQFDLASDWYDLSVEDRFSRGWWRELDPPIGAGLYTLEVVFTDGYSENRSFTLEPEVNVIPVDDGTMSYQVMEDGAIQFNWDLPAGASDQEYELKIRSTDGSEDYYGTGWSRNMSSRWVGVYELRRLQQGRTYHWFIRAYDPDGNRMEESTRLPLVYDPFLLAPTGSISGRVTDTNLLAVEGVEVKAFYNKCGKNFIASAVTNASGDYTIEGVFGGDIYVEVCATCRQKNYIEAHYTGPASVPSMYCQQAVPVAVADGQTTANVNFTLENGPRRLQFFNVLNYSGTIAPEFGLLPGFREQLVNATLQIPNSSRQGFQPYSFDLIADKIVRNIECNTTEFWTVSLSSPVPADYGTYTLTLNYADGSQTVHTKTLQPVAVTPVANINLVVNDDGSADLTWNRQTGTDQYYIVRVRDAGNLEYCRAELGLNAEQVHLTAEQLRCLGYGQNYRWLVRAYDDEYILAHTAETIEVEAVYAPNALPTHLDGVHVYSWAGELGLVFDTRPGSRSRVKAASVTGPDTFNTSYDLVADWVDISTETSITNSWWRQNQAWPISAGTYTYTIGIDENGDGAADRTEVVDDNLRVIPGIPVASAGMSHAINADGSITFQWTRPSGIIGQRYQVRIRSIDGAKEFYASPSTYNMTSITVPAWDLRGLLQGLSYQWFVRAWEQWDSDTMEESARIQFVYDPFNIGAVDSDGDGLPDTVETNTGTYVSPTDTGSDPTNPDTDGDGLNDGEEVSSYFTNPVQEDSDGDGFTDLHEVQAGTDPNIQSDVPSITQLYVDAAGDDKNLGDVAHPLKTLHKAVSRANESPESAMVINLPAGTYSLAGGEPDAALTIEKDLSIIGAGAGAAIVDGAGAVIWTTGLMISDGAPDVTAQGVSIRNFQKGIAVQSSGGCLKLLSSEVSGSEIGLQLAETYHYDADLTGSTISGCGTGLALCAGTSNTVVRNGTITLNTGDGIRLEGGAESPDDNLFTGVLVQQNGGNGIVIHDGTGNRVENCDVLSNNTSQDAYGGIAVFSGCNVVLNTTIQDNQCFGIYADDALSTQPLEAIGNQWGDISGPSGVGPGSGDAVSENVVFAPWTGLVSAGDDDSDGWTNLAEAQAGTSPTDGNDYPSLTVFQVGGPSADDANLGDAAHPLQTLHGAMTRINGIANGSYAVNLPAGTFSLAGGEADGVVAIDQNVTIVGAGAGATIIDGAGAGVWTTGLLITDGAPDVTIQGVTIRNFNFGIQVQSDGGCLKLLNSVISNSAAGLQLAGTHQYDVDLTGSTISGCGTGLALCAGSSNVAVRNGIITLSTDDGIRLEGGVSSPNDNLFTDILVQQNGGNGIVIHDGTGNRIENCDVLSNNTSQDAYGGIAIFSGCNTVIGTTIQGNQCFGVYADDALSTQPLTATDNWWGSDDGPSGLGPGSGDAVSENVVFAPWTGIASSSDDDNDGWPYLAEIQAGTDPDNRNSHPGITEFYVGGVGADDSNLGTPALPLRTLHGAVKRLNAVADGDYVIHLAAGVYSAAAEGIDSPVVLDQNVTIFGNGAILDGTGSSAWTSGLTISIGAENVTIQGLTIRNFEEGIRFFSDGGCATLNGVLIEACTSGMKFVESYQLDVNMSASTIAGCATGIDFCAGTSNVTLRNGNVRNNSGDGIRASGGVYSVDNIRIEGTQVINNDGNGIVFYDGSGHAVVNTVITGNNVGESGYGGIAVFSGGTIIDGCSFTGNHCHGVYADNALSTEPLNAINNWWGGESGPFHAILNPTGLGDPVSDNVEIEPWVGYQEPPVEPIIIDANSNGLPDWWETVHQVSDPNADNDGDGITNIDEYQSGSDPNVPVSLAVTAPAENPVTLDNVTTITVSGTSANATLITITRNKAPIGTLTTGLGDWSHDVAIAPGENLIAFTASDAAGNTATDSVTVSVDSRSPLVTIEKPTAAENYTTALAVISLSGIANDDTEVADVTWTRTAGADNVNGAVSGTNNWTTTAIPLVENIDNVITVVSTDRFGKTAFRLDYRLSRE